MENFLWLIKIWQQEKSSFQTAQLVLFFQSLPLGTAITNTLISCFDSFSRPKSSQAL